MLRFRSPISTAALLAVALCFCGCRKAQTNSYAIPQETGLKQYPVRGVVVASDAKTGEITLDAKAIPGYMEAMTMPYELKQPSVASELHRGDRITATLLVGKDSAVLDDIDVIAQAQLDYKPAVTYNDLEAGETIPDFRFLNQSDRTISLGQFKGKVLLLTFIYTRCPLPNFCVRMSRNFAEIDKMLQRDPALYGKTHLLSVSFDPQYDTPKVLRSYGGAYTGRYTQETFQHWDFAAPPETELKKVLLFFDIGLTPEGSKTITHSLSTVVIAPDGKLYKWYPGNEWTPEQVLADVHHLAGEAGKA